jgi:hypothetical protein
VTEDGTPIIPAKLYEHVGLSFTKEKLVAAPYEYVIYELRLPLHPATVDPCV